MTLRQILLGTALVTAGSCGSHSGPPAKDIAVMPPPQAQTAFDKQIAKLRPAQTVKSAKLDATSTSINDYFQRNPTQRAYVMTDKPLYQPGETIWFRADLRATQSLVQKNEMGMNAMLMSPRGAMVAQKRVLAKEGVAANDFQLSPDIEGGEYTLQLTADDGTMTTKKIIVNTYEAPRLKKSLELLRKAYGEGDTVTAAVEIKRSTGEAFADQALTGIVTIDDVEVTRVQLKTGPDGTTTAKFTLPAKIARGDGLLTILADDGGVTESIQKRIPIVMKTMQVSLFPEGGDLVEDVPGRVYFSAKNMLGKPADVEGKVVDDRGTVVAQFTSVHDGMGRFELTPSADRTYHVEITKPVGIAQKFDVPAAKAGGCVVRSVEQGSAKQLRVAAICSSSRTVLVEAVLREKRIAAGAFEVAAGKPALIELPIDAEVQGATRVTLFSAKQEPLAERLVYQGRGHDLKISMTADKKQYSPRDPVKLHIKTVDAEGKPVKANIGVAVVDDTVLSYADDKSGRMLAKLYLEPELNVSDADPIEEPNFYFGTKPEASAAMDALLATRGYRKFEWQQVFAPPPPTVTETTAMGGAWGQGADLALAEAADEGRAMPRGAVPAPAAQPMRELRKAEPEKPRDEKEAAGKGMKAGGAEAVADARIVNRPVLKDMDKNEEKQDRRFRGAAGFAKGDPWADDGENA
ncbi:MAG TPA: MG2 domain-containing protein, partial [Kofleriaceae bacterium]|nr:MG2 domain-containing protein [Kofleriaceae bacterium]